MGELNLKEWYGTGLLGGSLRSTAIPPHPPASGEPSFLRAA